MDEQDKKFTKGFNNGYLIAKYQPDLFEKIEKSSNSGNEYFKGMLSGKKEYDHEKKIIRFANEKIKRTKNLDKDQEKEY
jgi:hypothetical protein